MASIRLGDAATGRMNRVDRLLQQYHSVRRQTELLAAPLSAEDCVVQSMPDASPTKWHLAHTTWFFETFVLSTAVDGYRPFSPQFAYLFNSYYNAVGEQFPRPLRGLMTRPTLTEVQAYRRHVDAAMQQLLAGGESEIAADMLDVIETGLHHEQQHQELILTDAKHLLSSNPLSPAYCEPTRHDADGGRPAALGWIDRDEGLYEIGHAGDGFSYDNESPRHRVLLAAHQLADRLTTNGEFEQFIRDRGYERPELWLSEGWGAVQREHWSAPLYWRRGADGAWSELTLDGLRSVTPSEPVCHVSYFEADAFARWAGARLPTEAEWEVAATHARVAGNFVETGKLHPAPKPADADPSAPAQLFGDVWEWTSSSYAPYPGYRPPSGALGEYNGKFMCNQYVLRGGSCATPQSHIRAAYRNFFPTSARWQFSGVRLARDA